MKLKHCPYQNHDLPLSEFSSSRAKFCNACKHIRQLKQAQEMQQRAFDRLQKKKRKTKGVVRVSDLKKQVQRVFNKWIRERDKNSGCISCGNQNASSYEAGHYIAQGASGYLRYDESNVHKQCYSCNHFKHANLVEYRISLVKKIGVKEVERLEFDRHKTKKWQREELEELLEKYS